MPGKGAMQKPNASACRSGSVARSIARQRHERSCDPTGHMPRRRGEQLRRLIQGQQIRLRSRALNRQSPRYSRPAASTARNRPTPARSMPNSPTWLDLLAHETGQEFATRCSRLRRHRIAPRIWCRPFRFLEPLKPRNQIHCGLVALDLSGNVRPNAQIDIGSTKLKADVNGVFKNVAVNLGAAMINSSAVPLPRRAGSQPTLEPKTK